MKLINKRPDRSKNRKLKAAMWILILLTVGATVGGAIVAQKMFPPILIPVVVVGVILLIVVVCCFIRPINRTSASVEILRGNIGVCEHCGRYFDKSEIYWKLGDVKSKTVASDMKTVTEYKGTIYIEERCPNCGTKQTASIYVDDLGKYTESYKNVLGTDYLELRKRDNHKSTNDLAKLVEEKYERDLAHAQSEILDYQSRGFVLACDAVTPPATKKDNSRYNVFLAGDKTIKEAVAVVLEEKTYRNYEEALAVAVSGGTVMYDASSDEADDLMFALKAVGAKVSKTKVK